jgi:hypothetical protein
VEGENPIYFWVITIIPFDKRLVKIQYTELKLSCGNDPVVRNYIYSNGDLDLSPNDPKINRVLPLPQGRFHCGRGRTLFILGSLGQRSRSPLL